MPRQDIEFKTVDNVTLRGWLYTPDSISEEKQPCLLMHHGFSALKEMDLDTFADYFSSRLPLACLVFDNRGFGASDTVPGQPRQEIIPSVQCSDLSDAITYAQSKDKIDPSKIGIWGSSYSGGHVLYVAAVDKRVKTVISQVPLVDGWENFHRLVRPDFVDGLNHGFQAGIYHSAGRIMLSSQRLTPLFRSACSYCWKRCYFDPRCGRGPAKAVRTTNSG